MMYIIVLNLDSRARRNRTSRYVTDDPISLCKLKKKSFNILPLLGAHLWMRNGGKQVYTNKVDENLKRLTTCLNNGQ